MLDELRGKPLPEVCNPEEVLPIINKISIFAGLTDKQLYSLFRVLEKVHLKPGRIVFTEGEPPSHIYIIRSGRIKLVVNAKDTPLELCVLGEGHCFGETSVIGIQPHAATAIAIDETDLIILSRTALLTLYKSDLELFSVLILNIAREASRRLHKADEILLHYVFK